MQRFFALCIAMLLPLTAMAQSAADDTQARIRTLEEQVRQLQEQVRALTAVQQSATPAAPTAPPQPEESLLNVQVVEQQPSAQQPPGQQPAAGAAREGEVVAGGEHHAGGPLPVYSVSSGKIFNPDIGMIGNFIAAAGQSARSLSFAPSPALTLQESELSLQSIVDPYARADFFLALGEEGIEVEEGYVTFTGLPKGFLAKAGKMRASFGRLNSFHNHTLPWVDRPIVMYNLLGGATEDPDTGIKDAGISVSHLGSVGPVVLELTGEVFRGDSGTLFQSSKRSDVSTIGHVRTYFDISDAANFEGGASYARGHNDLGSDFTTQVYGLDLTYRWRPPARAIYRSLALRSELMWSNREEPAARQKAFGLYGSAEYQFARRWTAGARYDWSERATNADLRDRGASAVLTFRPSEFSSLRWQYRRSQFAGDKTANELSWARTARIRSRECRALDATVSPRASNASICPSRAASPSSSRSHVVD